MRTKLRSKVTLLFMMLGMLLAVPAVAWAADNVVSDGDGVAPITDSDIVAGSVPCNSPTEKGVLLALRHQGSGQIFKNSSTVTVSVQSVSGSGLSASMGSPNTITLPSTWEGSENGTLSNSVSAKVTINPTVTGGGSGTVTYQATGTQSDGTSLTRTDEQKVSWTAGSCDSTAPSVTSISTANANPTKTTGNVSWTVQFSENVSGVDASDFATDSSGGLGGTPAVTNVAQGANASVYTVTASSGSGSGNLGLNLNDNDSIKDAANNVLGSAGTGTVGSGGTGNGSFDGDDYVIDRDAPAATPTAFKGDDADDFATAIAYTAGDWTNQDVRVTFTCADTGGASGLTQTSANQNKDFTTDTTASGDTATFDGTCADNAGNTAAPSNFGPIKIDKTLPVITDDSATTAPTGTAGSNGWFISQVTNTFKASDGLSGFLSPLADPHTFTKTSTAGVEGSAVKIGSGSVSDRAGNAAGAVDSAAFKIDLNNPSLGTIVHNNAASSNYCTGSAPSKPTGFNPSDTANGSGIDNDPAKTFEKWTTPANNAVLGTYKYEAKATDIAGRTATYGPENYTFTYGVGQAGGANYSGVLQPINSDGSSRFKTGSTVPVKFTLTCGGTPITDAVPKLTVKQGDTKPDPGVDEAISTSASTTGNAFRLVDATTGTYMFNLSTKSGYLNPGETQPIAFSQGTWTLGINFGDTTSQTIKIQLVR